jgi:hypothetical protein
MFQGTIPVSAWRDRENIKTLVRIVCNMSEI